MYQHGKRVHRPRDAAAILVTVAVVGAVILIAWYIVNRDAGSSTGPKANVPIVTDLDKNQEDETIDINEALFSMKLPRDWKIITRRNDSVVNLYTWVSTKEGADDRRLTLYIDLMPADYKLVKMQPLIPNGDKFLLGTLSDDCINFAGGSAQTRGNASFEAKWQNVTFMCDPIINNKTIGTGMAGSGISSSLTGSKGKHAFFFYYEDYNIYPNNIILQNALQSFVAK
ncbi:hypothetical protein H0V99_03895 [Candidatus Saccharibacteria bacterium]|nr:hypothetical protein [Candidatus Saccharibacteria bacterium]